MTTPLVICMGGGDQTFIIKSGNPDKDEHNGNVTNTKLESIYKSFKALWNIKCVTNEC